MATATSKVLSPGGVPVSPADPLAVQLFDTAGNVLIGSDTKLPVKAATGDIVDLATLLTVLGALADAAVGDASGSVNAHMRQVAKLLAATLVVDTELSAAAILADGAAYPTAGAVRAALMGSNGATLDMLRAGLVGGGNPATGMLNALTTLYRSSDTTIRAWATLADMASSVVTSGLSVGTVGALLYNASQFLPTYSKVIATLLASASRTITQTSADIPTYNMESIAVTLDMTVITAGPSVTLAINYKDPASGKYVPLLTGAAVTTISTNPYKLGPGLTAAANAIANAVLPDIIQIVVTANNANAGTYSVGYTLGG